MYQKVFPIINDAIYSITRRMKETTRALLIILSVVVLESFFFTNFAAYGKAELKMCLGSILVVIIAILSIRRNSGSARIKRIPYYFVIAFAVGILLVSFHHKVGVSYIVFAIDMLFVFPFLYYVLINNGYTRLLFRILSIVAITESVLSFIFCIYLSLRGSLGIYGNRVMGHLKNPNLLGMIGLIALISSLYLLIDRNNHISIDMIASSVMGIGVYYMLASSSRTAILAAIGCIFAFVVFLVKRKQCEIKKKSVAIVMLLAAIFVITLTFGMKLNDINAHVIEKKGTSTIESEQVQTAQEQVADEGEELQRRLKPDKDIDTFTSGRVGIWKIYINNFSLLGKEESEVADQFTEYHEWRAHNNIIEYCFKLGYIVGAIYVVFYVLVGVYGLKALFSPSYIKDEDYFMVAIIGSYALYALIEIATVPFTRIIPCFFFLSIGPLVFTDEKQKNKAQ